MFTSGFFNSINSDRRYNAEQMAAIFDGLITDGIFDSIGDHFQVTPASSGLGVNIGTGRAWLNQTWSYNDTAYPVTLGAASSSLARKDLICLKVDKSSAVRSNSLVVIAGTPAASPVEPMVTDDTTNGIYYHKLAAVTVQAGATSISSADITNYIGLSTGTPYVTGILSSTTVDELWSQWDGEFNDWWDDIKATLDDNIVTTILNKIDHITPKEATMNLYGFSHINPPPEGKTYQEYSTDAILNQISNLLNPPVVGDIYESANSTPKAGYIKCEGQTITRSEYPELFDALTPYKYPIGFKAVRSIAATSSYGFSSHVKFKNYILFIERGGSTYNCKALDLSSGTVTTVLQTSMSISDVFACGDYAFIPYKNSNTTLNLYVIYTNSSGALAYTNTQVGTASSGYPGFISIAYDHVRNGYALLATINSQNNGFYYASNPKSSWTAGETYHISSNSNNEISRPTLVTLLSGAIMLSSTYGRNTNSTGSYIYYIGTYNNTTVRKLAVETSGYAMGVQYLGNDGDSDFFMTRDSTYNSSTDYTNYCSVYKSKSLSSVTKVAGLSVSSSENGDGRIDAILGISKLLHINSTYVGMSSNNRWVFAESADDLYNGNAIFSMDKELSDLGKNVIFASAFQLPLKFGVTSYGTVLECTAGRILLSAIVQANGSNLFIYEIPITNGRLAARLPLSEGFSNKFIKT